eukprot:GHVH01005616.1.p1 GENE.GHVH01005616.1~~GHVH01005616.1.p1  ORF type:complete len:567 (+),score=51.11 GHVH01005616.1:346-2046(+)
MMVDFPDSLLCPVRSLHWPARFPPCEMPSQVDYSALPYATNWDLGTSNVHRYHVPSYSSIRRSSKQKSLCSLWMEMMSGGFTQSCSNWSLMKMLIPEFFILQLIDPEGLLPIVQLLERNTDVVISVSAENQVVELNNKTGESNNRLLIVASLVPHRLVYAVSYLVELLYELTVNESESSRKYFNVKCVLPRSSISRFIGRGGDTIRRVQEESSLSMSVSTLNHVVSERVLNIGFIVREVSSDSARKLDSLLSVLEVVIDVLQTDRNYSMNYLPVVENTGRPRVPLPVDRDQLLNLITTSAEGVDVIHFDSLQQCESTSQAYELTSRKRLKEYLPKTQDADNRFCPATTEIIDRNFRPDDVSGDFMSQRNRDISPSLPPIVQASMRSDFGFGPLPAIPAEQDWIVPNSISQSSIGTFSTARYALNKSESFTPYPTMNSASLIQEKCFPSGLMVNSSEAISGNHYYPAQTVMNLNLSTPDLASSKVAKALPPPMIHLSVDYTTGKVEGHIDFPPNLLRTMSGYSTCDQLSCEVDRLWDEIWSRVEQSKLLQSMCTKSDWTRANSDESF